MYIFYRISNNSYKKSKLQSASKEKCLNNFLAEFGENDNVVNVIGDNITDVGLKKYLDSLKSVSLKYTKLNNAKSFLYILNLAVYLPAETLVYFVEDDYLHVPGSSAAVHEGIELADYVTLYDHPDKYINYSEGGLNKSVLGGGEDTKVLLTRSTHWKFTNSTTMTFAAKVKTLREDYFVWVKYLETAHPYDYQAFLELRDKGRKVVSPIPSLSTHCDVDSLAPLVDWLSV